MRLIGPSAIVLGLLVCSYPQARGQNVPYQRLLHADTEPQNWLTYGADYSSQRFSRLKQINRENVANLRPVWSYQTLRQGVQESSPVVVDGIMYLTEPASIVSALDLRTGLKIWSWAPALPAHLVSVGVTAGAGASNRGVAILDNTVYAATIDAHLVALDAKTGAVRWLVKIAENKDGYALSSSPLAIDGKIIIGVGGAEAGARGFIDAYDAKTGKLLWRAQTVPKPGEPGSETWGGGKSWLFGGGSTWNKGSYDPDLNLIYWGTGNAAPDYNGDARPGDNLFTCSLLAIDATTGKVKWYFQFTPHDTHDWDAVEVPVLFDALIEGKPRKLLAQANRNGFYYVLDRQTGEFITGMPFVKETWAKGLDSKGRPIVLPDTEPSLKGTLLYPSVTGATNWTAPSYSPDTKLFYVDAREMGAYYLKGEPAYEPGAPPAFAGGGQTALSGDNAYGAIRALDVTTGKMKWEFRMLAPAWSSTLATAGGLVFSLTDEGNFFALDAETGKVLWNYRMGGSDPRSNPITYAVDGKQYVIAASGNVFTVFALP